MQITVDDKMAAAYSTTENSHLGVGWHTVPESCRPVNNNMYKDNFIIN